MASTSTSGGYAFHTILTSASTSFASSSGTRHPNYDVFINHCGKDVKDTVASRIFNALDATGLRVFLDKEELKNGDFFPRVLEEAMSSASLHIAILSQNYAEYLWCLAELAFMVGTGKNIMPVFYYVKPSDLIWAVEGKGIYADAFSEHEKKNRCTSEELQRWKLALKQVSCCFGAIVKNIDDEPRAVKDLVNRLMKEMSKVPLEDLDLKCKRSAFDNVDEGKEVLKSRLRSVSVLIIFDDVDHTDRLDALLPATGTLGKGSLIIVSTRDKHVIEAWCISAIYKLRAMDDTDAQQLFCWDAFLQPSSLLGFEDLVKKFINACHGLPLSLKVLGDQLYEEFHKD
ncbi:hypothetical protein SUGI_0679910 [Cryptomeria japonica]|nr:hypothetical protein SUGI_0679910 [Cryptomeria japonica]